jgi:hypothetical protein
MVLPVLEIEITGGNNKQKKPGKPGFLTDQYKPAISSRFLIYRIRMDLSLEA